MTLLNQPFGKPTFAILIALAVLFAVLHFTFIPAILMLAAATGIGIFINGGLHKTDLIYIAIAFLVLIVGYMFKDAFNLETWATLAQ
ncbi:hypothetical protein GO491_11960 [Flavobacteriaceae bacterium Ap0902]|nr:hypothetical protein [Flavobacteriaceae bacterium Ap0902]